MADPWGDRDMAIHEVDWGLTEVGIASVLEGTWAGSRVCHRAACRVVHSWSAADTILITNRMKGLSMW